MDKSEGVRRPLHQGVTKTAHRSPTVVPKLERNSVSVMQNRLLSIHLSESSASFACNTHDSPFSDKPLRSRDSALRIANQSVKACEYPESVAA